MALKLQGSLRPVWDFESMEIGPLHLCWYTLTMSLPLLPYVPGEGKKRTNFPFIFEKWRQLEGVRAKNPPISGAALINALKWWKKSILFLIIVGTVFAENRKEKWNLPWNPLSLPQIDKGPSKESISKEAIVPFNLIYYFPIVIDLVFPPFRKNGNGMVSAKFYVSF